MKNRFLFGFFILLAVTSLTYAKCSEVQFYTSATGDTIRIKETFNTEDSSTNEYLKERLKPIQSNFKRINSITKWSSVKKKSIEGESAEGGEATFYYNNRQLEKVIARHYGEMGQTLIEYYLMNGKLSFVFEKDYRYNRPLFYDEKTMKENNDTEAFDFEKSEITEKRNYFEKGNLIHILDSQDCGAPFSGDYIAGEEKKISEDFKRLIRLTE